MDNLFKTENVYYKWNMYQIQYNVNSSLKTCIFVTFLTHYELQNNTGIHRIKNQMKNTNYTKNCIYLCDAQNC
jgi:hypothetical protein